MSISLLYEWRTAFLQLTQLSHDALLIYLGVLLFS